MKVFLVLGVPGASMLAMMLVKIDMLTMPELEGKYEEVSQKTKSRCSGDCALEARHLRLRGRCLQATVVTPLRKDIRGLVHSNGQSLVTIIICNVSSVYLKGLI